MNQAHRPLYERHPCLDHFLLRLVAAGLAKDCKITVITVYKKSGQKLQYQCFGSKMNL